MPQSRTFYLDRRPWDVFATNVGKLARGLLDVEDDYLRDAERFAQAALRREMSEPAVDRGLRLPTEWQGTYEAMVSYTRTPHTLRIAALAHYADALENGARIAPWEIFVQWATDKLGVTPREARAIYVSLWQRGGRTRPRRIFADTFGPNGTYFKNPQQVVASMQRAWARNMRRAGF